MDRIENKKAGKRARPKKGGDRISIYKDRPES